MTDRMRNFVVGITAMVGIIMLAGIVLFFTGFPWLFSSGYDIQVHMSGSYGIHTGEPIFLGGMRVGAVTDVRFTDGDPVKGVTLIARIDKKYPLPTNSRIHLSKTGLAGVPYLEIKPNGKYHVDKDGNVEYFPLNTTPELEFVYKGGSDAFPAEFTILAKNINRIIGSGPEKSSDPNAPSSPSQFTKTLSNLEKALAGIAVFFGDTDNQKNFSQSLQNLALATAQANEMMENAKKIMADFRDVAKKASLAADAAGRTANTTTTQVEKVSERMLTQLEKLSSLLQTLHRSAKKVESGDGSVGKLLNDPALYNSLADAARDLSQLTTELRQLVAKWKKDGIGIKLK